MPDQEITLTDDEREQLERVRQQQGLASIEEAAQWLVKTRLRQQSKHISGRGRAMYVVSNRNPE